MGFSGIITRADVSFYLFARGISIRCCSSIFQLETWTDERSDGRRTINDCSCVRQYAPILLDRPATMAFQNAHLTSTRMEFHSHLCSWIPFELSPRNWLISTHPLLSTLRARSYFTLSNYISPRPRCSPQIFPFPRSPLLLSSAQSRAFISSTSTLILHFFPSFFLFFSFLGGERRDRETADASNARIHQSAGDHGCAMTRSTCIDLIVTRLVVVAWVCRSALRTLHRLIYKLCRVEISFHRVATRKLTTWIESCLFLLGPFSSTFLNLRASLANVPSFMGWIFKNYSISLELSFKFKAISRLNNK